MVSLVVAVFGSFGTNCFTKASVISSTTPDGSTLSLAFEDSTVTSVVSPSDGTTASVTGGFSFRLHFQANPSEDLRAPAQSDFKVNFGSSLVNSIVVPSSHLMYQIFPTLYSSTTPLAPNMDYGISVFVFVPTVGYSTGSGSFFLTETDWADGSGDSLVVKPMYQTQEVSISSTNTPEPASIGLIGLSTLGMLLRRRR